MIYHLFKILKRNNAFIVIGIVFFLICFFKLDSDYGWHIRAGEMIASHGVSTREYFTYSMPDYPFVDFEWGSHVLIWWGSRTIGYVGLALLYTGFAVAAVAICSKKIPSGLLKATIVLLAASTLFSFVGIRVQLISWLFFALVVFILEYYRKTKWIFVLPLLFLLWANFHGAFVLGLGIFGLTVIIETIQSRKIDVKEMSIFGLSILVTLLNPYGIDLWYETFLIITDSNLRLTIAEWLPVVFYVKFSLWVFCGMLAMFLITLRKSIQIKYFILCGVLFIGAMSSVRNIPYFILFSMIVFAYVVPLLEKQLTKNKWARKRFRTCQIVLLILIGVVFIVEAGLEIRNACYSSEKIYYPGKAVEFLKQNPSTGRVFTEYSWGGYLIWKYPDKKMYIDGRMSSWKVTRNGKEFMAFEEYQSLMHGKKPLLPFLSKYSIDTVLLPVRRAPDSSIDKWHHTLVRGKWKIVYQDPTAIIYRE